MHVAIIPARGGSKRIPRKNIKDFGGRPMIAFAIEAALESGLFENVVVSTDDAEIAGIARDYGAAVPFERPPELADDFAVTTDVMAHAADWAVKAAGERTLESLCCIYPTAPLLLSEDLKRGLSALQSGDWSYAFSVTDFAAPIFRAFQQTENGGLEMFFPEHLNTRSQDLPEALHDAGLFYWGRPKAWLEKQAIFEKHSKPVMIPRWRVQDIDTPEDWTRAEFIFKQMEVGT